MLASWLNRYADSLTEFEALKPSKEKAQIYKAAKTIKTLRKNLNDFESEVQEQFFKIDQQTGKLANSNREKALTGRFGAEIRQVLRSMAPEERLKVVIEAAQKGDKEIMTAVYEVPAILTGLGESEMARVREIVDQTIYGSGLSEMVSEKIELEGLFNRVKGDIEADFARYETQNQATIAEVDRLLGSVAA
jgi:hypothetical protein